MTQCTPPDTAGAAPAQAARIITITVHGAVAGKHIFQPLRVAAGSECDGRGRQPRGRAGAGQFGDGGRC